MKVLAFSDLHLARSHASKIVAASKEAGLVIGAGDFCNMRQGLELAMDMLSEISVPFVVVPGNAESAEELNSAVLPTMTVLHGTGMELEGMHLYGLGYGVPVTPFGAWSCDLSEEQAEEMLTPCSKADILILHSPPKGAADVTSDGQSVGSTAIRAAIERIQPRLAVCGHIHDSWGERGQIGQTEVVNLGPHPNWFEL